MAKKRKSEFTGLENVDRTLFSSFCVAANSISQLYTQAQNQQRLAFQAGERHAMEKVQQWITREQNGASYVSIEALSSFLQREIEATEAAPLSPSQHMPAAGLSLPSQAGATDLTSQSPTAGTPHLDSTKASVFGSALSSSLHRRNASPSAVQRHAFEQGMASLSYHEVREAGGRDLRQSTDYAGVLAEQQQQQQQQAQQQQQNEHRFFGSPVQEAGQLEACDRGLGLGFMAGGQPQGHPGFQQAPGRTGNIPYGMAAHMAREEHGRGHNLADNDANMDTYSR